MTDSGADASPRSPRPLRVIIFIGGLLSVGFVIFWALHQQPEDHHRLALLALRNRQEDAAVREFMMHLRQHPDDIRCKRQVASLIGKSDPELAIRLLKEIPESDPQYVDAARELVAICLQSQQLDEAVAVLNRLTRFDATQLGAQLSLAELYFRDRKFQESLLHAQRALELAPDRVETLLFLADVHDELLQPERMVEPLRHALTIDPESYTAHLNLAYALHRIGQIDAAAPHAEWCLERNPDEIAALRIL
ncbi:MAG: tetratricopeptide repeat protein, partial [Planctomycetaceae bacterium]|nr:tetratricopeptide repeat protein [Planctomycetaceae bacterium]